MIRSTESPACVIGSHGNAALETNVEAGAGLLEVFEAAGSFEADRHFVDARPSALRPDRICDRIPSVQYWKWTIWGFPKRKAFQTCWISASMAEGVCPP